jgi:hypothetical protein
LSVYLHVTLEVRAAGMTRFKEAMQEIVPMLEGWGWKLSGAFMQRTGQLNTIIDFWELQNFDQFDAVLKKFAAHERFPALKAVLDDSVLRETVIFADRIDYRM